MNRRSFLAMLGLAPGAAVTTKAVAASAMPGDVGSRRMEHVVCSANTIYLDDGDGPQPYHVFGKMSVVDAKGVERVTFGCVDER